MSATGWSPEHLAAMDEHLTCPDCAAPMTLRDGARGLFYACTTFPTCRTTWPAVADGQYVGRPAGRPVPRAVRDLRAKARALADACWPTHTPVARRRELERYAAKRLVIPRAQAALASLTPVQLARLVELLAKREGAARPAEAA